MASMSKPKYRIKNGDTVAYPGLATYTKEHMEGPNAEMIVMAMKKTDAKLKKDNFSKLIEEVK